jgi:DNA-binding NarL/FixJ family response regulator
MLISERAASVDHFFPAKVRNGRANMKQARILIADNHEITRIGVKAILSEHEIYYVCGEASDGYSAVAQTRRLRPDIAILEIGLPLLNGVEVTRRIVSDSPQTAVLIFTEVNSQQVILESLRSGVKGFMSKCDGTSELLAGIDAVSKGRLYFPSLISEIVSNFAKRHTRGDILSGREREITQLIAAGRCNKDIAQSLGVTCKTVDSHRGNIMRKLHIHTVAGLTLYAIRNGLVEIERSVPSLGSGEYIAENLNARNAARSSLRKTCCNQQCA